MTEIHLELLLRKRVVDAAGQKVGRIEEIRAEQQGNEWIVQEYLVGVAAMLERFSAWTIGLRILNRLGARSLYDGFVVPWNKMDLSDPDHPRLTCTVKDLKAMTHQDRSEPAS